MRKHPRWPGHDYSDPGYYLVTAVTYHRRPIFGAVTASGMRRAAAGDVVARVLDAIPNKFPTVTTDTAIVMPDHIHVLLSVRDNGALPVAIGTVIRWVKGRSTYEIHQFGDARVEPVWQRTFHDRVVRSRAALEQIRRYIVENPARAWWKMCERESGCDVDGLIAPQRPIGSDGRRSIASDDRRRG